MYLSIDLFNFLNAKGKYNVKDIYLIRNIENKLKAKYSSIFYERFLNKIKIS